MPITGIKWRNGEGYDVHMLRGMQSAALLPLLQVTETDGTVVAATAYLAANADVTIDFQPTFNNVLDVTVNPPPCTGFGIVINNRDGVIRFAPPAAGEPPDPGVHNFLIHATAQDSSDDSEYRTSIRIHLHRSGHICLAHPAAVDAAPGRRHPAADNPGPGAPNSLWRMFQLSHTRGSGETTPAANLFFLPPSLLQGISSPPVEEVLFLRDEMANLAWAVERVVESATERPLNRFEVYVEAQRRRELLAPAATASASGPLHYRLSTEVPDYWIPLMPVRTERGLRLRRGAVLKMDGPPEPVHGIGRILTPDAGQALELFEEEIPREGIRVTRSYQYTRWVDGSTHLWIGRRKAIGRGEGSSGLRFDTAESNVDPD